MEEQKGSRRRFSSQDKAKAVKRHVLGGEAVSAVCTTIRHLLVF